jgi:hypothetical protein
MSIGDEFKHCTLSQPALVEELRRSIGQKIENMHEEYRRDPSDANRLLLESYITALEHMQGAREVKLLEVFQAIAPHASVRPARSVTRDDTLAEAANLITATLEGERVDPAEEVANATYRVAGRQIGRIYYDCVALQENKASDWAQYLVEQHNKALFDVPRIRDMQHSGYFAKWYVRSVAEAEQLRRRGSPRAAIYERECRGAMAALVDCYRSQSPMPGEQQLGMQVRGCISRVARDLNIPIPDGPSF